MKRLACVLLLASACYGGERASTGKCPAGETCSSLTPNGLYFVGDKLADQLLVTGPAPTAIGGTQAVALQYDRGDGVMIALDLPFTADDDGGGGVRIDHTTGSVVTVRGAGSRSNYLRILDASTAELFDRKELTGAALDTIELVPTDFETLPAGAQLAWATGEQSIGVALRGQVQESSGPQSERLVDDSMQLALAGADRTAWDTLHLAAATVGTFPVAVTAGDKPAANLDLVVVDHADAIAKLDPTPATIPPGGSATVCFQASAAGRFVVGLTWTFTIDGVAATQTTFNRNCIGVTTTKTTGSVTIMASAGGQTMAMSLPVGAGVRLEEGLGPRASGLGLKTEVFRTPLGDRAAL